jgi:hypothetical protein
MRMAEIPILTPSLQLGFYQRFLDAENSFLLPALLDQVSRLDIAMLDAELTSFVGNEKLAFIAKSGLRGELVFPVPYLIRSKPMLLAYYRLLLGFSQKEFYKKSISRFKMLEERNLLTGATAIQLEELCTSLIQSSWILVNGLPEISQEILKTLTLLTLGPQLRGSRNVSLGSVANQSVFTLIKSIVISSTTYEGDSFLEVTNGAGRVYRIHFAPDPDIAIRQMLNDGSIRNKIAIEIKGGTDFSNIHNRLGEAEKSHQKAKGEGYTQFWTVINVSNVSERSWKKETPTTNELFHLDQILDPWSEEHIRFKEFLVSELGI